MRELQTEFWNWLKLLSSQMFVEGPLSLMKDLKKLQAVLSVIQSVANCLPVLYTQLNNHVSN